MNRILISLFFLTAGLLTYFFAPPKEFPSRLEKITKTTEINNQFYDDKEFAATWNDSKSWAQGLHLLNPTRLKYIKKILEDHNIPKTSKILDVGCGGGILTNEIGKLGYSNLHGIDLSENSVKAAKSESLNLNLQITYQQGDIYKIPYEKDEFDVIILADVLDHLTDVRRAMAEISRVLKNKGMIFFETIDRNFMSNLLIKVFGEALGFIPKNTHDYRLFIKPQEVKQLFDEFDFTVDEIKGVDFKIGLGDHYSPIVYNSSLIDHVKHVFCGFGHKK